MRVIALGDTHGRRNWKKIVANDAFDQVIFIGDYFDSQEEISPFEEISNFEEIIAYKKASPEKVVLLVGNHDFHYLPSVEEAYSRFQRYFVNDIQAVLQKALEEGLLQMSYVQGDYLFTHAGVTKTWFYNTFGKEAPSDKSVETLLNKQFIEQLLSFKFTPGKNNSPSGEDITQSPIWVRPNSLRKDAIAGFIHVVGHTQRPHIELDPLVVLIDTLGHSGQYLSITNGQMGVEEPPEQQLRIAKNK